MLFAEDTAKVYAVHILTTPFKMTNNSFMHVQADMRFKAHEATFMTTKGGMGHGFVLMQLILLKDSH